jgi:hypothetical protein
VVLNVCADLGIRANSVENVRLFYVYLLSLAFYCRNTYGFRLFNTQDIRNSEI